MGSESCIEINSEEDIVRARQAGRLLAQEIGFDEVVQSEVATTISELARNIYMYAQTGSVSLDYVEEEGRVGLSIRAQDQGPGISDIQKVMTDGFSTSGNLGAGLPGIKRIMDEFSISSSAGEGTEVITVKWLPGTEAR